LLLDSASLSNAGARKSTGGYRPQDWVLYETKIETNHIPLAALWVYDFAGQVKDWDVTTTNDRNWQLEAIAAANKRMQSSR